MYSLTDTENLLLSSDEEEDVQLTPAEVIEMMEGAWINEKFAPEILPHRSEIVDCLLAQVTSMEENIQGLDSSDFKKSIHQLEVDRLRFLVSSYLRTRLEKIECYSTHILKEEAERSRRGEESYLSEQESVFARNFSQGLEFYFDKLLNFYPGLPTESWSSRIIEPNLHSFIFVKSKTDVEGVIIDDGTDGDDLADFRAGTPILISYNSVSGLVKKGDVNLI
ncbi:unnamed protein product [Phaedon cochleariae]|uniref:DNA replication complex GINS protein SLD5 n=1 Tax=Phaedon cochleariae TaxID=80249 RepID=A0A9P0DS35_PHACE|nr:unnamed protein product [Phaedon cochleariae]